jgi:hypothetical protein
MDLTTVSDHHAVVPDGSTVDRYDGLQPDTAFELSSGRTIARPSGDLLCRVGTGDDVRFGDVEACFVFRGRR